jgi:hypothetical protein
MGRCALEVADIFRAHGPAWRQSQQGHLSLGQLKVMSAIELGLGLTRFRGHFILWKKGVCDAENTSTVCR